MPEQKEVEVMNTRHIVGLLWSLFIVADIIFAQWLGHLTTVDWLKIIALMIADAFMVDWK